MTSGQICYVVNSLTKAVCDLKTNNKNDLIKSQTLFNTDFYANRRLITVSLVTYEYYTNEVVSLSRDEIDLIREYLLTYLDKYDEPHINDIFVSFGNNTFKTSFVSYERASKSPDSSIVIKSIESDISNVYENSIFKILLQFLSSLPQEAPLQNIKNLPNYFKSGNYFTKFNVNMLVNRSELENISLNWNSTPVLQPEEENINQNFKKNMGNYPFEPYAPHEPYQPFEPSAAFNFNMVSDKVSNINTNNFPASRINESEIKAAISRILEITTTEEITHV